MKFYIHKDGYIYSGDLIDGAREATQEEIRAHLSPAEPTKEKKLAALDAVYQPQFVALAQALGLATLDANAAVIDGVKADYAALKAEYQAKAKEIG